MSLNCTGKILETSTDGPITTVPPFDEIDAKILGDDGEIYLIPSMFDYMKIDKSLRSPVHKGFIDYQHVGQKVNFSFFEWNNHKIINAILIDLTEIEPIT